jgi:hypothetical protein
MHDQILEAIPNCVNENKCHLSISMFIHSITAEKNVRALVVAKQQASEVC